MKIMKHQERCRWSSVWRKWRAWQGGWVGLVALAAVLPQAARAQSCTFYPIALPASAVSNAALNSVLTDIYQGQASGNFGWLSWAGSPSVPTLVTSLTPPGNSDSYVNPTNAADHQLSIGEWVPGKPGVSN